MADRFKLPPAKRTGNLALGRRKWPQRRDELLRFGEFVVAKGVRAYLEVGVQRGFTLRYIGSLMPTGSRIVGVDNQTDPDRVHDADQALADLRKLGQDACLIVGDSTDPGTVTAVAQLGPYDLVLIDADHTAEGVRGDWHAYGPMGSIIAFHDIDANTALPTHAHYGVPALWRELARTHRNRAIIGVNRGCGIGILWR
jgi:predicted O-methyltransferase YrrM